MEVTELQKLHLEHHVLTLLLRERSSGLIQPGDGRAIKLIEKKLNHVEFLIKLHSGVDNDNDIG